jgi:uncharacterized protein (DUF302 family)
VNYFFSKILDIPFDEAVDRAVDALKEEQFGVLTTIDVSATMKKKLDIEFPRYTILGACNPALAHQALQLENKIGTMLPCNVIVRDNGDGRTEVAAVDPVASMQAIENPELANVAATVQAKLSNVIKSLSGE